MDILVAAAVVIALSALIGIALRFAADSRDGLRSEEHQPAMYGMTRDDPAHEQRLAIEILIAQDRRLRGQLSTAGLSAASAERLLSLPRHSRPRSSIAIA